MKLYGSKRSYNQAEDSQSKYDGWKGGSKTRTQWKKILHRRERRTNHLNLKNFIPAEE